MKTVKATWSICGSGSPIEARQIEIETPYGTIQVGLDNNDRLYIQSQNEMTIKPESTHRFRINS